MMFLNKLYKLNLYFTRKSIIANTIQDPPPDRFSLFKLKEELQHDIPAVSLVESLPLNGNPPEI